VWGVLIIFDADDTAVLILVLSLVVAVVEVVGFLVGTDINIGLLFKECLEMDEVDFDFAFWGSALPPFDFDGLLLPIVAAMLL